MKRSKVTHYEILGVLPTVSADEIKQAYRSLVKSKHPDLSYTDKSDNQVVSETEFMMSVNEAYSVLIDVDKRADYDLTIFSHRTPTIPKHAQDSLDEERARERFLRAVFNPLKRSIATVLKKYKAKLQILAQDIYAEDLLEDFEQYVEEIERTLLKASREFTDNPPPMTLIPAVQWMRHAIAQASDGLDELRYFLGNYDYDHLAMADNLFKIAAEHLVKAGSLAKLGAQI
ncbi:MAG: DnaJ domain-containing protein [Candidatus Melainabacteria bacterium]|nr:DnaJ domain-containing protein [Candidatus Melainabacteria bacterium]